MSSGSPEQSGFVRARVDARSFKTIHIESEYGPGVLRDVVHQRRGANGEVVIAENGVVHVCAGRDELTKERFMAKPVGPFSPWRRMGQTIATSGQIGLGEDGKLVQGGFEAELEQALRNLASVLADAGVTREQVIKVNVYLADIADWPALNGPYAQFFGSTFPARTAFGTSALPLGARVEIEAWAVVEETR